jgi:hypothetical protein
MRCRKQVSWATKCSELPVSPPLSHFNAGSSRTLLVLLGIPLGRIDGARSGSSGGFHIAPSIGFVPCLLEKKIYKSD